MTMDRKWKEQTGTIRLRRLDDGAEFIVPIISTFHELRNRQGVTVVESKLKKPGLVDGRSVFTPDEKQFFFEDEPARPMMIIAEERQSS
jgi:hypothetical protein